MNRMSPTDEQRLADYAERLRRLHNTVRPLLPEAQQDELLELAIGVGLLVLRTSENGARCICGHSRERHRNDPVVCLDCWHTPTPNPDSSDYEHVFAPCPGEALQPPPVR